MFEECRNCLKRETMREEHNEHNKIYMITIISQE